MHNSWKEIFNNYPKEKLEQILNFVEKERETKTIFPREDEVFRVFDLSLKKIKVVILGQDPYHNENQACGLSFSVNKGVPLPKSLINIYTELENDLNIKKSTSGDLTSWHEQGIFLLNAILTVEKNKPASHRNIGWEELTDYIISEIDKRTENIVFVLWGNFARSKKKLIKGNHLIIESAHPSPLSSYRGFFNSKPFSKINEYLTKNGKEKINFKID